MDFIVRTARRAAEEQNPITFCAIGPMTNLALALIQHRMSHAASVRW